MGMGGSIPFIAEFQQAFPNAAVLVTGVEDPDTRAHGIDEGLHLEEFAKVCLAEALLLQNLACIRTPDRAFRRPSVWHRFRRVKIAVVRETRPAERRVALVPEQVVETRRARVRGRGRTGGR